MDETRKDQTPQKDQDDTLALAIALQLWDNYWDERQQDSETERAESLRLRKTFAELSGARENSPISLMFVAFYGGLGKGLELGRKLWGGAEETEP